MKPFDIFVETAIGQRPIQLIYVMPENYNRKRCSKQCLNQIYLAGQKKYPQFILI